MIWEHSIIILAMNSWLTKYKAAAIPLLAVYTGLVIRTAWIGDDAYITFRVLENFLHGYGPLFNVGERVQVFTHPLWFLMQAAANAALGWWKDNPLGQAQMYFLNLFASIGLSFLTLAVLTFRTASSSRSAILGLAMLTLSKAFLDYSSSGLENPLTHLILVLFVTMLLRGGSSSERMGTRQSTGAAGEEMASPGRVKDPPLRARNDMSREEIALLRGDCFARAGQRPAPTGSQRHAGEETASLPAVARNDMLALGLLAALGSLDRLDTLLLYLPALVFLLWQSPDKRKTLVSLGLGFLPLIVWELFSLFYYGAAFPNTAYAKINTGIPALSLIQQGLYYYLNSLRLDPLTVLAIVAVSLVVLAGRNRLHKTIIAGVLLYLLYTLYIGGDFMSGRYFSAPLLACAAIVSNLNFASLKIHGLSLGLIVLIGIAPIYLIPERRPSFGVGDPGAHRVYDDGHGISDERRVYEGMSLAHGLEDGPPPVHAAHDRWSYDPGEPLKVRLVGPMGLRGYVLGPNVHVIDLNSLADPLMARLPLYETDHWRIGHFRHIIPEGYLETLETGENVIADRNIARYYDKLALVMRGELWSWARMVEIWNLNTGMYDQLLEGVSAGN